MRNPQNWRLHKLGRWVSPLEVVAGGNRNLHGIDTGAHYHGPEGTLAIDSLDAALLAPGRPRLLEFDQSPPNLAGGLHLNLYNNIWGTNFPMWYDQDATFRFTLHFS